MMRDESRPKILDDELVAWLLLKMLLPLPSWSRTSFLKMLQLPAQHSASTARVTAQSTCSFSVRRRLLADEEGREAALSGRGASCILRWCCDEYTSVSVCVGGGGCGGGCNTLCCFPRFERPLIEHLIECECNRKSLGNEATARQQGVTHDMMEIPAATPP